MEAEESQFRFLCVFASDEKVAAAYYSPETNGISVLSQMPEPGTGFEVTQQILRQVEPTITIIPSAAAAKYVAAVRYYTDQDEFMSRTPKHLSDLIDSERTGLTEQTDAAAATGQTAADTTTATTQSLNLQHQTPVTPESQVSSGVTDESDKRSARKKLKRQTVLTRITPNLVSLATKFFAYETAKNTIMNYEGWNGPVAATRTEKQSLVAGVIDLEETVTVRAVAGLLTYLTRSAVCQNIPLTGVQAVAYFRLANAVRISDVTLRTLAVISRELIPRREQLTPSYKPSLSLFGLYAVHCKSQLGKKKLRQLLVQPIRDHNELNQRLDFVEHFSHPDQQQLIAPDSQLVQRLQIIQSLNSVFRQMRTRLITASEWKTFNRSFSAGIKALEIMKEYKHPVQMAERADELLTPEIRALAEQMEAVIDFSQVVGTERLPANFGFELKKGNMPEYDEYRQMLSEMDDYMRAATFKEVDQWHFQQQPVPSFKITFVYGPGFLLALSLYTSDLPDVVDQLIARGAYQIFRANTSDASFIFFKTPNLQQFDLEIGDKVMQIPSILTRVQTNMQLMALNTADDVTEMLEFCASVEALLSFAHIAKQESWVRPTFSVDQLDITNGRHPLHQALIGQQNFVSNSLISPSRGRKIHLITGPNNSGKTVFMKQMALIVHSALCGSFVPAEKAVIPIVDSIFTTLKQNYSITMETSSFFSDLTNMSSMISQSTGQSLLVIDEFGKGTRPQDGIALLAAAIKHFAAGNTPFMLIATHFHSVIELLKNEVTKIQYLRFRPDVSSSGGYVPDYKIEEGKALTSLASAVYVEVQLDPQVAERANEVYQMLRNRIPLQAILSSEQKRVIETAKLICKMFNECNLGSRAEIEDMFEKVRALGPI